jgi:predicted molibdopterin-dependent oxidoreductase YjgC
VISQVNTATITLTVDGRPIHAHPGQTVLEVCRGAGVHIPTLCHDPRLEPYGGCRMCIVEIDGMRGYPTSCTTLATDGMVITTASDALFDLRRTIVELLLSDHKVECLTCESNGRCELQDVAYEHGIEVPALKGDKHRVEIEDDNPLIARDLDKCISCGRCVRICREVQGCDVYDTNGRGFDSLPGTPFDLPLLDAGCEFCGQCVSTCPTGALTDRPSRFLGRPWEVTWTESTCGYCGVGCTIEYAAKGGRVVGTRAPLDKGPNYGNLCAKGRYGWSFTHHEDRLTTPLIRRDGRLVPTTWDEAIAVVATRLSAVVDEHGSEAVGGLASAKCTNEESYLFQKLMRAAIGTHNIDHCARL